MADQQVKIVVSAEDKASAELKKVNKKEIIEIFENYDFKNKDNKKIAFEWFDKHNRIFGWIYKNYLVFYTHF
jgi:hypothetical protein